MSETIQVGNTTCCQLLTASPPAPCTPGGQSKISKIETGRAIPASMLTNLDPHVVDLNEPIAPARVMFTLTTTTAAAKGDHGSNLSSRPFGLTRVVALNAAPAMDLRGIGCCPDRQMATRNGELLPQLGTQVQTPYRTVEDHESWTDYSNDTDPDADE